MRRPPGVDRGHGDLGHVVVPLAERQAPERIDVVVQGQPELLEVVVALHPPRRLPRRLHGRQEQRDQDRDDRDDDQELDQREARTSMRHETSSRGRKNPDSEKERCFNESRPNYLMSSENVGPAGIRVDCNLYPPAIGIGATAALIGSMMANAENSAVASVRSSSSASESPSAEILRICSSLIV